MEYFKTEKQQEKRKGKQNQLFVTLIITVFPEEDQICIKYPAFLYPFSPSLHIKHLTMLHELFLVLGGRTCYATCVAKNGGGCLKMCVVSAGPAVISCGSASDICAKICA
jgi:hypothetical protein